MGADPRCRASCSLPHCRVRFLLIRHPPDDRHFGPKLPPGTDIGKPEPRCARSTAVSRMLGGDADKCSVIAGKGAVIEVHDGAILSASPAGTRGSSTARRRRLTRCSCAGKSDRLAHKARRQSPSTFLPIRCSPCIRSGKACLALYRQVLRDSGLSGHAIALSREPDFTIGDGLQ